MTGTTDQPVAVLFPKLYLDGVDIEELPRFAPDRPQGGTSQRDPGRIALDVHHGIIQADFKGGDPVAGAEDFLLQFLAPREAGGAAFSLELPPLSASQEPYEPVI